MTDNNIFRQEEINNSHYTDLASYIGREVTVINKSIKELPINLQGIKLPAIISSTIGYEGKNAYKVEEVDVDKER